MLKLKAVRSPLLALVFVIGLAGTALATLKLDFAPTELSRGTLAESVHYNTGEVKFQTKGPVTFVTQTITILPGGHSGWHSHPGVVLVTVKAGSLRRYDADCAATPYATGSSFTESGDEPGIVRNESTSVTAVVYATFVVPAGSSLRNDVPVAPCP